MWQCALQSVSQEMDSVWLLTIVAVVQDGQAVSVKHAYQLMDAVSYFLSTACISNDCITQHLTLCVSEGIVLIYLSIFDPSKPKPNK